MLPLFANGRVVHFLSGHAVDEANVTIEEQVLQLIRQGPPL